ncbi:MAG: hypothetical protein AABY15_02510, partial [Nanoarchaeota archaeon]
CVSLAINLKQHVIYYEGQDLFSLDQNKFPYDVSPKFVYKVFEEFKINGQHHSKIETSFDGVIGAGLGSSGAIGVAVIGAINRALNLKLSKNEIAERAFEIENRVHYTGRQDQYVSLFGGMNSMVFEKKVGVYPINRTIAEKIYPSLFLLFLGKREHDIQKGLKELSYDQILALHEIKKLAEESLSIIEQSDIEHLGNLLTQAWEFKKKSNKVSSLVIDQFYEKGLKNGAYGGKLLGSGGSGYLLFIIDPSKKEQFAHQMGEPTDFEICYNGLSTRIL